MTVEIYTALKTKISAITDVNGKPVFKTVKMFFNDIDLMEGQENPNTTVLRPSCLIQFTDIECSQLGNKASVQQVDFNTVIHLVWDIRTTDDLSILSAKQRVYQAVQNFELGPTDPTSSRFLRIAELPNPDYKTLIVYQQIYKSTFKDFTAVNTPATGTIANMTTNYQPVHHL